MRNEDAAIALLQKHDRAYARGREIIPDQEYDRLRDRTAKKYPTNPYFKKVGAKIATRERVEVKLPIRLGSLAKKRPTDAAKWVMGLAKGTEFVVTPKLDGLAILLTYRDGKFIKAYTRGEDGVTGFDVTENLRHVAGVIPQIIRKTQYASVNGWCYVLGEVIIRRSLFTNKYRGRELEPGGRKPKAARNFCIGMINRLNIRAVHKAALADMLFIGYGMVRKVGDKLTYLDKIDAINRLSLHGFRPITLHSNTAGTLIPLTGHWYADKSRLTAGVMSGLMKSWGQDIDVDQDGVVIDINQHSIRQQFGFNEPRPGYAYAVKPEPEDQISLDGTVASVKIDMTSRRIFIPVWILEKPLNFKGVDVRRITAHNCITYKNSKAGPGAIIKVIRSGDVIPDYQSTVKPAPVELPRICPECRTKLLWTKNAEGKRVNLYCPNDNCTGPQLRRLRRFFTFIKIDGMAKGVIEAMVAAGLDSVPKILTATSKQLSQVEGFGQRKTARIAENLRAAVKSVDLALLMKASNCFADHTMGFGESRLKPIITRLGRKAVLTGPLNDGVFTKMRLQLMSLPGIGERVAEQFLAGLPEFREFYRDLTSVITLKKEQRGGKLAGKVFAFTNFRSKEMEELITKHGGTVGGVTGKTTVLFAADLGTDKAAKAAGLGIKVVMRDKAMAHLEKMVRG